MLRPCSLVRRFYPYPLTDALLRSLVPRLALGSSRFVPLPLVLFSRAALTFHPGPSRPACAFGRQPPSCPLLILLSSTLPSSSRNYVLLPLPSSPPMPIPLGVPMSIRALVRCNSSPRYPPLLAPARLLCLRNAVLLLAGAG